MLIWSLSMPEKSLLNLSSGSFQGAKSQSLIRNWARHWSPGCRVAGEWRRCRKYSRPPPDRSPPSTPPYQGIRHSRRSSHQIFWWSRDRRSGRREEELNCWTRSESARKAREVLDSFSSAAPQASRWHRKQDPGMLSLTPSLPLASLSHHLLCPCVFSVAHPPHPPPGCCQRKCGLQQRWAGQVGRRNRKLPAMLPILLRTFQFLESFGKKLGRME